MTGGLGATNAMEIPRQIFGAARNLQGGGSLTMIATILVDTGSRNHLSGIEDSSQQAAGNALAVSVQLSVVYRLKNTRPPQSGKTQ